MAPSITEPKPTTTMPSTTPKDLKAQSRDFAIYRQLVPLLTNPSITYLNVSFQPPSNLIVHGAISAFNNEALVSPSPKQSWLQTGEDARSLIARYINAHPTSVAITRDTTEGLNNFAHSLKFKPGDNVVILDSEHPHHAYAWMSLRPSGLEVRQIPTIPDSQNPGGAGVVAANAETFAPYVDARTVAIGLSSVMFHSGQWNDVQGICDAYRPRGIHVLADLTQQVGFAAVDVSKLNVSAAAFSLHKGLNCPTGFAAMYVHPDVIKDTNPIPPIVGYGAVQNVRGDLLVPADEIVYHPSARRFDHLNMNLVAAAAAKAYLGFYLDVMGPGNVEEHLYGLGGVLRRECNRVGVKIVGPEHEREHASHLYILDLHDGVWMELFKAEGICVTPYRLGIRVSFGFYNNVDDVLSLVRALEKGIEMGIPVA